MKLSELTDNQEGIIIKVQGYGAFRKRITEMGFIKGKKVTVIKNAPLKDPVEYQIMGYQVSLRRSEAALIEVITKEEAVDLKISNFEGILDDDKLKSSAQEKGKNIHVALVGNPNAGKTTLFNFASGSKEHVGNYSGVTVDSKLAKVQQSNYKFDVVDLPGTYSLTAYTSEELYVRQYITEEFPDVVINVVDASNLERNLYLTTQLIDMDVKVILALNMYDELEKNGARFNYQKLGKMLGIPIIPTVSSKGKGIKELFDKAIDVYEGKDPIVRHIHINYGAVIEKSISKLQEHIRIDRNLTTIASPRFLAIKLLEGDDKALEYIESCSTAKDIKDTLKQEVKLIESTYNEVCETVITDAKYGFIDGALKETYTENPIKRRRKTAIIDTFLTHKLFGFPLFFFFMFMTFYATFNLGQYPMDWIDAGIGYLSEFIQTIMPDGPLKDLIVDGIIGGVGGVIVFLPNILILFFFISFMEDTGYMARTAFIMDKLMHKIGLHGKSFIPLVMGFGCNVPALMATRTLENRNDRILTMLITPFMSCSARLPVYILIIGTFFPNNSTLVLFGIYILGIVLAVIFAKVFKASFFKSKEAPFVMELPPYRIPTLKSTLVHMWSKGSEYLKKMGGIILVASVIIWALGYFPLDVNYSKDYEKLLAKNEAQLHTALDATNSIEQVKLREDYKIVSASIMNEKLEEKQELSYIGQIGNFIAPVFQPLGFDWKMTVSILTGIAAKEVVVSTMGVLYQNGEGSDENSEGLRNNLREQKFTGSFRTGEKVFDNASALAFLIFILIYFPCIAVVATITRESNWKWSAFVVTYTTALAWVVSFIGYQIVNLL
ncbi:ferrous iron transport protein B [Ancylomarina euxinus]|uniref:Ferrous iron transport protein B n=2 Tax=Ancylomarina euxinus TaxID=2283627 RepID=A0A425Y1H5_9BACT|nr:ferrous iron transport protein B [Ancylomarina euxinus]MCZ4695156.1 ferrous iron transport protein B [Ancylomarina euxinus]MUP14910.1 ferrous iron transport protein B [Ancylomarina euxinus]RRG21804.1 ferrous iron transport protein B [Ancylomarina euxinus]